MTLCPFYRTRTEAWAGVNSWPEVTLVDEVQAELELQPRLSGSFAVLLCRQWFVNLGGHRVTSIGP